MAPLQSNADANIRMNNALLRKYVVPMLILTFSHQVSQVYYVTTILKCLSPIHNCIILFEE